MNSTKKWPCAALHDADLSGRTTMRVGGYAETLLEPATPEEFRDAWIEALERGVTPRVLGGGANLIIEGGTLPGVVMSTERMRRLFRPMEGDADPDTEEGALAELQGMSRIAPPERGADPRLVAWCGATLPSLLRAATDLGYSGLEGLAGVPGSVGGGVAMNAGGRPGWTWDAVESIRVMHPDGTLEDRAREDCQPVYRDGGLGELICLGAVFRFEVSSRLEVRERVKEFLAQKNAVQPVSQWSAGCIFKNPDPEVSDGKGAGQLVDECGGKGLQRGSAEVSPLHGNFIVNRGEASSADVLTLIEDLRDLVAQKTGIRLETEVKIWRRDPAR